MLKLKRIGTTEQKTRTKKNNFIKDKDGNQKTSLTTIQLKLPGLNINSQMQTERKSIRNSQSSMPIQRIDYFPQYSILKKDSLKEKYHCYNIDRWFILLIRCYYHCLLVCESLSI